MSVNTAYLGVILIWSTTPLAIKWSGEDVGFLFGITARMLLGTFICLLILAFMRLRLAWHRQAIYSYLAASIAIYGSMMCVYWGAQYISSGLLSVLFGLTPLLTGIFAALLLSERSLTIEKLLGIALGIGGLAYIFQSDLAADTGSFAGISAVVVAATLHSLSTVTVKKLGCKLPGLVINSGALIFASVLFIITWLVSGQDLPDTVPIKSGISILYLGILGNVVGFTLYYYALKHMDASKIGLIPLITPVIALSLGYLLNQESVGQHLITGAGMIMLGLIIHQWHGVFRNSLKSET